MTYLYSSQSLMASHSPWWNMLTIYGITHFSKWSVWITFVVTDTSTHFNWKVSICPLPIILFDYVLLHRDHHRDLQDRMLILCMADDGVCFATNFPDPKCCIQCCRVIRIQMIVMNLEGDIKEDYGKLTNGKLLLLTTGYPSLK